MMFCTKFWFRNSNSNQFLLNCGEAEQEVLVSIDSWSAIQPVGQIGPS